MNEPEKKDGIWIKTNNQYEHILINQKYSNYQSGVWSSDTPLPQAAYAACSVSYNNEIYTILGVGAEQTDARQRIYKYNNGTWSLLGSSPKYFLSNEGSAIFYNGQLYMAFGGEFYDALGYIYRYKNNDFSNYLNAERVAISYNYMAYQCNLISYNNILYCVHDNRDEHTINVCKVNNNFSVTEVIPAYENKQTIGSWLFVGIFNGNVYVLCDGILYSTNSIENIKSNTLSKKLQIPNYNSMNGGACIKDNIMHIFLKSAHYITDGNTITQISTLPHEYYYNNGCVIYGDLHMIAGNPSNTSNAEHFKFQSPQKVYSPNTLIINRGNSNSGVYLTAINDNSEIIKGNNNRFVSGFDDCFYFADSAFDWNAPMYYGDGSRWVKFKN
jgi:hypothetical protein